MARIGGGLGSWLAMSFFHHKKNHSEFKRQIPMWIMIWLFVFALVLIIFSGNLGKEIQDAGDSMIHSSNAF